MAAAAAARSGRPPCCRGDQPRRRAAPRAPGRRGRAGAAARRPLAGRRYGERRCRRRRRRGGRRLARPGQVGAALCSAPLRGGERGGQAVFWCEQPPRARPALLSPGGGVGWGVQAGRPAGRQGPVASPEPSASRALSPPAAAGELPPAPLEMPLAPCLRRAAPAALPFLSPTLGSPGRRSVSVALAGFGLNTR